MTRTHTPIGPQFAAIEAMVRVARRMSWQQVERLAVRASLAANQGSAREAARAAAPGRARALEEYLREALPDVFPGLRHWQHDEEGRLHRFVTTPVLANCVQVSFALMLLSVAGVLLAAGGVTAWQVPALAAGTAVTLFVAANTLVVLAMRREDTYLASLGMVAWSALVDAAYGVAALDLCDTAAGWGTAEYDALTRAWDEGALRVPRPTSS